MRIVLFGSGGDFPIEALRALGDRNEIAAVVRPGRVPDWRRSLRRWVSRTGLAAPDTLSDLVREHGAILTCIRSPKDAALADTLDRVKPDLLCIASFPWLLPERIVQAARRGALNLHPSLLPRHRGPNPWFWIYHADDRETGITVHDVTPRADAGAILGQVRFPLPRGFPIETLYLQCARTGAQLLAQCVSALEESASIATPQDDTIATRAPAVKPGVPMVDFASWPAERVWHFLAGMHSQYREPFRDTRGNLIRYRVLNYESSGELKSPQPPGTLLPVADGWRLCCRDGVVNLASDSA